MISLAINIIAFIVICVAAWFLVGLLLAAGTMAISLAIGAIEVLLGLFVAILIKIYEIMKGLAQFIKSR